MNDGTISLLLPSLAILVPILAGIICFFLSRKPVLADFICFISALIATLSTAILLVVGSETHIVIYSVSGVGEIYGYILDNLSMLIAFAVALVGFLILVYTKNYLSPGNREDPVPDSERPRFYGYMLVFMGSMLGFVFSSTLLEMIIFFELTSFCSWGLIGFHYEREEARRSAYKALVVTHVAALGLYIATGVLYSSTGSLSLYAIPNLPTSLKTIFMFLVLVAAWGKSAQFPFWTWLPDAMVAPTPASAYLHAAAMVKVGIYLILRVLLLLPPVPQSVSLAMGIMAMITMLLGFLMYFPQRDFKRLLAYSTITQLSYMFLASAFALAGSKIAFAGALLHFFNHVFTKGLLFLVAGSLSYTTGSRFLDNFRGLYQRSPFLTICFATGALAITGAPPFAIFFSKYLIILGGLELHNLVWPAVLAIIALGESVGSFAWFIKVFQDCCVGSGYGSKLYLPLYMKIALLVLIPLTVVSVIIAMPYINSIIGGGII